MSNNDSIKNSYPVHFRSAIVAVGNIDGIHARGFGVVIFTKTGNSFDVDMTIAQAMSAWQDALAQIPTNI